jgi:hypothetical protein
MFLPAVPAIVLLQKQDIGTTATRASDAIRPAPHYQVGPAIRWTREVDNCFLQRCRLVSGFHTSTLAVLGYFVKYVIALISVTMPDVNKCSDWSATIQYNTLRVHGQCTFPTPGFKVSLEKKEPEGINPAILLLEKTVFAPTGIEAQHVATIEVSFEEQTTVPYSRCRFYRTALRSKLRVPLRLEVPPAGVMRADLGGRLPPTKGARLGCRILE